MRVKKALRLTEEQKIAVTASLNHPVVVMAGPGSGKTTVIVDRLVWMVKQGIPASDIIAVTFSERMASELFAKVYAKLPEVKDDTICTIHAFCFRLLKKLSGQQVTKAKEWTVKQAIEEYLETSHWDRSVKTIRWWIDKSKMEGVEQSPYELRKFYERIILLGGSPFDVENLVGCTLRVNTMLVGSRTLTFPDMINRTWRLLQDPYNLHKTQTMYKYVLVDEGQDTFGLAVSLLRLISPQKFFIVGDVDQLMYRFTGAAPEDNLFHLSKDAEILKLQTNFRATQTLVDHANRLITNNYSEETKRFKKILVAGRKDIGEPIEFRQFETPREEAIWIANVCKDLPPEEIFVGARTNAQLAYAERAMFRASLPYVVSNNYTFFTRTHIKAVMGYLALSLDPHDDTSFELVYNIASSAMTNKGGKYCPHRYLGKKFLEECKLQEGSLLDGMNFVSWRFKRGVNDLKIFINRLRTVLNRKVLTQEILSIIIEECYLPHCRAKGLSSQDASEEDNITEDLEVLVDLSLDYSDPAAFVNFCKNMSTKIDDPERKVIVLSTIHKLKGLERKYVFGMGWSQGLLPHARALGFRPILAKVDLPIPDTSRLEDERCVAFVLVTRAKERVWLTAPRNWGNRQLQESQFIAELGAVRKNENKQGD